jgi:hypothetical protein
MLLAEVDSAAATDPDGPVSPARVQRALELMRRQVAELPEGPAVQELHRILREIETGLLR